MATRKSAPVAGSVQGPAVIDPATIAGAQEASDAPEGGTAPEGEKAPEVTPQPVVAPEPFPREILIANDTPMAHIVAATLIAPGSQVPVVVRNQDEITRIETDCQHLMALTPAFAALEVQPLRVIDAAAK